MYFIDIGIYTFREAMGPIFVWFHLWFSFQFRWSIIAYRYTALMRSTFLDKQRTSEMHLRSFSYYLSYHQAQLYLRSFSLSLFLIRFTDTRSYTRTHAQKTFNDHNNPGFVRFSVFLYKWALKKKWSLVFLAFKVWNQFYERS